MKVTIHIGNEPLVFQKFGKEIIGTEKPEHLKKSSISYRKIREICSKYFFGEETKEQLTEKLRIFDKFEIL